MTTTITWGTQTVTPTLVTEYTSKREGGNLLHIVIGNASPDVTLKAAGLRKGTLEIWCEDHATALAAEALHAQTGVFHLTDDTLPGVNMFYVLDGAIDTSLDGQTSKRWLVQVGYAEVTV